MNWKYRKAPATSILLLFVCASCSTMSVSPELAVLDNAGVLTMGPIQYDGKSQYLPRTVSQGSGSEYGLTFRYATTETHHRSGWHVLTLVIPLPLVGFPTGELTSTVTGKLEILKETEIIKSYTATCVQKTSEGIYYGASFKELRRKGLIAVRDNIEAQMSRDREFFQRAASKGFLQSMSGRDQ